MSSFAQQFSTFQYTTHKLIGEGTNWLLLLLLLLLNSNILSSRYLDCLVFLPFSLPSVCLSVCLCVCRVPVALRPVLRLLSTLPACSQLQHSLVRVRVCKPESHGLITQSEKDRRGRASEDKKVRLALSSLSLFPSLSTKCSFPSSLYYYYYYYYLHLAGWPSITNKTCNICVCVCMNVCRRIVSIEGGRGHTLRELSLFPRHEQSSLPPSSSSW